MHRRHSRRFGLRPGIDNHEAPGHLGEASREAQVLCVEGSAGLGDDELEARN